MAVDPSLSPTEKVGFPDEYRAGREPAIFQDILSKLSVLNARGKRILDIGPGCSPLALALIEHVRSLEQQLLLVDSREMLDHLPESPMIRKFAAFYPECPEIVDAYRGQVDCVICYSVFHYVFAESNMWHFLDATLGLFAQGGQFLLGDIPNVSKRKRFFSSPAGIRFHQAFVNDK